MARRTRLSQEEKDNIIRLHKEGNSAYTIANLVDRSLSTVTHTISSYKQIIKTNVEINQSSDQLSEKEFDSIFKGTGHLSDAEIEQIIYLYKQGITILDIANMTLKSDTTVLYHINKYKEDHKSDIEDLSTTSQAYKYIKAFGKVLSMALYTNEIENISMKDFYDACFVGRIVCNDRSFYRLKDKDTKWNYYEYRAAMIFKKTYGYIVDDYDFVIVNSIENNKVKKKLYHINDYDNDTYKACVDSSYHTFISLYKNYIDSNEIFIKDNNAFIERCNNNLNNFLTSAIFNFDKYINIDRFFTANIRSEFINNNSKAFDVTKSHYIITDGLLYEDEYYNTRDVLSRRIRKTDITKALYTDSPYYGRYHSKKLFDYIVIEFPLLTGTKKKDLEGYNKNLFKMGYICCERSTKIPRGYFRMTDARITKDSFLRLSFELKEELKDEIFGSKSSNRQR